MAASVTATHNRDGALTFLREEHRRTLSALQDNIRVLQERNAELTMSLAIANSRQDTTSDLDEVKGLRSENDKLKEELQAKHGIEISLKARLEESHEVISRLRQDAEVNTKHIVSLQESVKCVEGECAAQTLRCNELSSQLSRKSEEVVHLTSLLHKAKMSLFVSQQFADDQVSFSDNDPAIRPSPPPNTRRHVVREHPRHKLCSLEPNPSSPEIPVEMPVATPSRGPAAASAPATVLYATPVSLARSSPAASAPVRRRLPLAPSTAATPSPPSLSAPFQLDPACDLLPLALSPQPPTPPRGPLPRPPRHKPSPPDAPVRVRVLPPRASEVSESRTLQRLLGGDAGALGLLGDGGRSRGEASLGTEHGALLVRKLPSRAPLLPPSCAPYDEP